MKLNVKFPSAEMRRAIDSLGRRMPPVAKRALRRGGTAARTRIVQLMGKDTGLPARRIRGDIEIKVTAESVKLEIKGNRVPLIEFRARGPEPSMGRGRGVTYRLPGSRGRAPHAFIATMRSGHRGVFQRYPGEGRNPIYQLHGPSLVKVFDKFTDEAAERGREIIIKNLRAEVASALSRR